MEDNYCIMTFYSTHLAMEFERTIDEAEITGELIPVPRVISSDCGLAGKFARKDLAEVKKLCQARGIDFDDIYHWEEIND